MLLKKKEARKEGGKEGRMEREREEGRKEEEVIKEAQKRKENVGCLGSPFPKYFNLIIYRGLWHPTPVLLPGKSHGRRSLVGCSPWGREESDTTERLPFHFSLLCIGEGNGSPLQCSCLESPRDGEAWWAVVYGVTQSQTQPK